MSVNDAAGLSLTISPSVHAQHAARCCRGEGCEDARDERKKIFERVAWRNHDDDTEGCAREILLELDILISREQDLETLRSRTTEKFTVRNARPALLLHGNDVMPSQLACELTRKLLIEQDAHRRSEPRAQLREQR